MGGLIANQFSFASPGNVVFGGSAVVRRLIGVRLGRVRVGDRRRTHRGGVGEVGSLGANDHRTRH